MIIDLLYSISSLKILIKLYCMRLYYEIEVLSFFLEKKIIRITSNN